MWAYTDPASAPRHIGVEPKLSAARLGRGIRAPEAPERPAAVRLDRRSGVSSVAGATKNRVLSRATSATQLYGSIRFISPQATLFELLAGGALSWRNYIGR